MSCVYISPALRQLVHKRAGGRCEYCLIPETTTFASHEIDHIISQKHGGPTAEGNLALSCVLCNKRKGTDLASVDPATGQIVQLYHPRRDRWRDHFQLSGTQIIPLTAIGRATIQLLQLNHKDRLDERELLLAAEALIIPE
ncbi:MAG: HNH endonuclease [bacterium]